MKNEELEKTLEKFSGPEGEALYKELDDRVGAAIRGLFPVDEPESGDIAMRLSSLVSWASAVAVSLGVSLRDWTVLCVDAHDTATHLRQAKIAEQMQAQLQAMLGLAPSPETSTSEEPSVASPAEGLA